MADLYDRFGQPLATASTAAVRWYVDGIDRLLSFDAGADDLLRRAIAADQRFALAEAALAVALWQTGERPAAQVHAHQARSLAGTASRRERQQVATVVAVVDGGGQTGHGRFQSANPAAVARCRDHLSEFPRDALALFLISMLMVFSGQPEEQEDVLALYRTLRPDYGDDWWFLGWYGFCHQELGNAAHAAPITAHALALQPRNPIAAHAYGHQLYNDRNYDQGAGFLHGWTADYHPSAPYHSHLQWHLAMCDLKAGRGEQAVAVYQRAIDPAAVRPARTTLADAAGLLWRCQLAGAASGSLPWDGVRDYAARLVAPGLAFRDVLAGIAFAGAGDDAALDDLVRELEQLAAQDHPLASKVVLPLVLGVRAFAQEAYPEAIRLLEPVHDETWRIGGSSEQRELFHETLMEAYRRAGAAEQAALLNHVQAHRKG